MKLPPLLLKELRAPVGTQFFLLHHGGGVLTLFQEREEKRWEEYLKSCVFLGRVGAFSLADLLGTLNMGQKTGVLLFQKGELWQEIFFRRGDIVFARTNDPQYRLGNLLVRRGILNPARLEEILAEQRRSGGRLGGILVKKGVVTAAALFELVRYQVEEIVYSIFSLDTGFFAFFEGIEPEEDLEQFSLNAQNILMEGYRRFDEWGVIREKIPHDQVVLIRKVAELPGKPETAAEPLVFKLVDGRHTVRQIVKELGIGEFEVYRALYDLLRKQAIDVVEMGGEGQERLDLPGIVAAFNRLFLGLYRLLQRFGETKVASPEELAKFTETLDPRLRPILKGIRVDPEKGLDADSVLKNLEGLKEELKRGGGTISAYLDLYLRQQLLLALEELLNYLLFAIKNLLPPKHADPLIQKVRAAQKEIRQRV